MRLPLQSTCDQSDPKTAHQWVFVELPFAENQPHTPDTRLLPLWSQRLDDAGYRHVDQIRALANEDGFIHVDQLPEQRKRFRPPHRGQQHVLNASGVWVDMNAKDPEPVAIPDPAEFTPHEQAVMRERMYHTGVLKRPEPAVDKASVGKARNLFNPSDYSPSMVNGYLMGVDDTERRRVLAAEMTGKKRQQILRNPLWKGL
ncbi:phage gene 29 protein family protein [Rhodococcus pyridinivorans]|uniref:phage gene 29 protein family protein n=1 Tax=Rhodococcus pyridinivorans TaxID=103816 RepID=UPI003AADCA69